MVWRLVVAVLGIAGMMLAVHEDVGAYLKLGQHAERRVDVVRPGSPSGHDPRRELSLFAQWNHPD